MKDNTILKAILITLFTVLNVNAQEDLKFLKDTVNGRAITVLETLNYKTKPSQERIKYTKEGLDKLHKRYSENLKTELRDYVNEINKLQENEKLNVDKASRLKEDYAFLIAYKIDLHKQKTIADQNLADAAEIETNTNYIEVDDNGIRVVLDGFKEIRKEKKKINTYSGFGVSFGYNFMRGDMLGINDFSYANNSFFSIRYNWLTQLDKRNHLRLRYGIAYQSNSAELNGGRVLSANTPTTQIIGLNLNATKAKFRQDQLVIPIHIEFGGAKEKTYTDGRIRYDKSGKWKVGLGGFAGINLSSRLKLKYEEEGRRVKQTLVNAFDTNALIYGLDAYVGKGAIKFFGRLNLNKVFKSGSVDAQYVSFGIRL